MKKQIFFMALVLCTQLNAQTIDTTKTLKEVVISAWLAKQKTFIKHHQLVTDNDYYHYGIRVRPDMQDSPQVNFNQKSTGWGKLPGNRKKVLRLFILC